MMRRKIALESVFCKSCNLAHSQDKNGLCEFCRLKWRPSPIGEHNSLERFTFNMLLFGAMVVAIFTLDPLWSFGVVVVCAMGILIVDAIFNSRDTEPDTKVEAEKEGE